MPPRKGAGTRSASTRSTKASTKASKASDENASATEAAPVKEKASKATSKKKALAPLSQNTATIESDSTEGTKAKSQKKTSSRSKEQAGTSSVPSSPPRRRLPDDQVDAFLDNYDLETSARINRLKANLEISIQSAVTRMKLVIDRIPRAVRQLSMKEFMVEYGGDIHIFMGRGPVQHLEEGKREWEKIKENSPVKGKRTNKDDGDPKGGKADEGGRAGKAARRDNKTAVSPIVAKTGRATGRASRMGGKTSRGVTSSQARQPTSPTTQSNESKTQAPSLSTFAPSLPAGMPPTPANPRPRAARPGETIQWHSVNGSPIVGVIGSDGVVRPMTFMPVES